MESRSAQPETTPVRENHRFDENRLERYLVDHMNGFRGPLDVRQFVTGQSNPTFLLGSPSGRLVMRKKPAGQLLQSAHQVEREYQAMTALANTGVPVPRTYLLCNDSAVIGTPFFIMDYVEGRIFTDPLLPGLTPAERTAIYDSMNESMARLHLVDYRKVGLGDFGRPDQYIARQVRRWTKQYRDAALEQIPEMDRLIEWMQAHIPADDETTIAHGDFRLPNLIVHPIEPRIVAVLDWELSTLGHPIADLAWNCLAYHHPKSTENVTVFADVNLKELGIPREEDYLAAYCRRTGRSEIRNFLFFVAFCFFRGASIAQGIAMRARIGTASAPDAAAHGRNAAINARIGWSIAQQL